MKSYEVRKIGDELSGYMQLKMLLSQMDGIDEKTLLDSLEGETELHEALCALVETIADDEIMRDGIKARLAELNERLSRVEKTIETKRTIVLSAMAKSEIKTIRGPLFTLTAGTTAPKPFITNEAEIPSEFWKPQPPRLDRTLLAQALKDRRQIPGAELDNGGISLTIRKV